MFGHADPSATLVGRGGRFSVADGAFRFAVSDLSGRFLHGGRKMIGLGAK